MYLTQITVKGEDLVQRRIFDSYRWHQCLFRSFGKERFLYRVYGEDGNFRVLVQSLTVPIVQDWGAWVTKEVLDSHLDKDRFMFSLRANPTTTRDGKRLGLFGEAANHWLQRKASECGFEIEPDHLQSTSYGIQVSRKGPISMSHAVVEFDGVLRVTDKQIFYQSVKAGIGAAKAFGFGLLLLKSI